MAINAMHVAKTGLNAQQVRMQIISNNLANVNTNGFKRDRANFESKIFWINKFIRFNTILVYFTPIFNIKINS